METYFDILGNEVLGYIIKKLVEYSAPSNVIGISSLSQRISSILNENFIYIQSLEHDEMIYSFKRFDDGGNWISKFLLYKTLNGLIQFVDSGVKMLRDRLTKEHSGLFISASHGIKTKHIHRITAPVWLKYLNVPGIDYEDIQISLLKSLDTGVLGDHRCQIIIYEKTEDGFFFVEVELFKDDEIDSELTRDYFLDESQLRILLAGILYMNITITDSYNKEVFPQTKLI